MKLRIRLLTLFAAALIGMPLTATIAAPRDGETTERDGGSTERDSDGDIDRLPPIGPEDYGLDSTDKGYEDISADYYVTGLEVERGGTYLRFKFSVSKDCSAAVFVSRTPLVPLFGGTDWACVGDIEKFQINFGAYQDHDLVIKDLEPDTQYFYYIRLKPDGGELWQPTTGSEVTRRRFVGVEVDHLYMIDDSDDWSDGEALIRFFIGQPWAQFTAYQDQDGIWQADPDTLDFNLQPKPFGTPPSNGLFTIESGETVFIGYGGAYMSAGGVGPEVKFAMCVLEEDVSGWGNLNTPEYKPPGEFNDGDWEANGLTHVLNLEGGTDMFPGAEPAETEVFNYPFNFYVDETGDTCLEFEMWGYVYVWYE